MEREHANQIALLLNSRNELVKQYDPAQILEAAENYLYRVSDRGEVIACVELKRVQWYQFEVAHLTTASAEARRGYARELLTLVEERAKARGCRVLQCTIRENNKPSRSLFAQVGFIQVSRFHYPNSGNNVGVWQKVVSPAH